MSDQFRPWINAANQATRGDISILFNGIPAIKDDIAVGRGYLDQLVLFSRHDPSAVNKHYPEKNGGAALMYQALIAALGVAVPHPEVCSRLPGLLSNAGAVQKELDARAKLAVTFPVNQTTSFDIKSYALILRVLRDIRCAYTQHMENLSYLVSDEFQAIAADVTSFPHFMLARRLSIFRQDPEIVLDAIDKERWDDLLRRFVPFFIDAPSVQEREAAVDAHNQQFNIRRLELQQQVRERKRIISSRTLAKKDGTLRGLKRRLYEVQRQLTLTPLEKKSWIDDRVNRHAAITLQPYGIYVDFAKAAQGIESLKAKKLSKDTEAEQAALSRLFAAQSRSMLERLRGLPYRSLSPWLRRDEHGAHLDPACLAAFIAQSRGNRLADLPSASREEIQDAEILDLAVQFLVSVDPYQRERVQATFLAVKAISTLLRAAGARVEVLAYVQNLDYTKNLWECVGFCGQRPYGLALMLDHAAMTKTPSKLIQPVRLAMERLKNRKESSRVFIGIMTQDYVLTDRITQEQATMDVRTIEKAAKDGFAAYEVDFGGKSCGAHVRHASLPSICSILSELIAPK